MREQIQEDIVLAPRTVVTCYQHGQAFCSRCNRQVVQAGEAEILNAPIGLVAKSVALYLRYRIGIPYRKTTEVFRDLFGLSFVPAAAVGFDWESTEGIEKQLVNRLAGLCKKPLAFKPAETLRGYLAGPEQKYLFTFLRHPAVPPTNNLAEQAIR